MRDGDLLLWILAEAVIVGLFLHVLFRHGIRTWMAAYGMFVLAPFTMAPFAYDEANRRAVGSFFAAIRASLDEAVALSVLGLALFAVGALWAVFVRRPPTRSGLLPQIASTWDRQVWTPLSFWLLIALSLVLTLALVAAGIPFGSGLSEAFTGRGLRPMLNVWQSVFSLSVPFCVCYALSRPSGPLVLATLLLLAASFYTGQRTVSLINMIIGAGAFFAFRKEGRLSLRGRFLVVILAGALLLSSALVYQVRSGGQVDLLLAIHSFYGDFAYGNQFSDIRDFAWVLSGYDGEPLGGLSYLAGFASPFLSADSPLRADYGIGRWTLWTAGLDTNAHGGLRMPFFSELYFNFGLVGLGLVTPILGYLTAGLLAGLRRYSLSVGRNPSAELLAALLLFLLRDIVFTSAMFRVPVVLALVVGLWALNALAWRPRAQTPDLS
jgi:oligosaccharide repeat unit polymerase